MKLHEVLNEQEIAERDLHVIVWPYDKSGLRVFSETTPGGRQLHRYGDKDVALRSLERLQKTWPEVYLMTWNELVNHPDADPVALRAQDAPRERRNTWHRSPSS